MEEEKLKEKKDKPKNKKKIIIIISIIAAVIIIALLSIFYIIPKVKEEGVSGLLKTNCLTKEDEKVYDLYFNTLKKYEKPSDKNYDYFFVLDYIKGVDNPVIIIEKNYNGKYLNLSPDKVSILYIKDGKVETKDYDTYSRVYVMYNTEKDEFDYYLYIQKDNTYTYTLLKDIVTESESPYTYTFRNEEYHTTYKNNGQKVGIALRSALFVKELDNYQDNKKYDQEFSFNDGMSKFKGYLKKAICSKYYLSDLLNETDARKKAEEELSYYSIKFGQKIMGTENADPLTGGSIDPTDPATSKSLPPTENNATPDPGDGDSKVPSTPTTKCNSGYVYVSEDNRCYNSSLTKNPLFPDCQSGYDELNTYDCGKQVSDASLCSSNPDDYDEINGKCYDKQTIYNKTGYCPAGYEFLWGEYDGQVFNGDCYKYMSPNF